MIEYLLTIDDTVLIENEWKTITPIPELEEIRCSNTVRCGNSIFLVGIEQGEIEVFDITTQQKKIT